MDALQAAGALIQGVQALLQGVQALVKAAKDVQDAPKKVAQLEEVMSDLSQVHGSIQRSYSNKLHHPELETQLGSLESLIQEFRPQIQRAKKLVSRRKGVKMYMKAVVTAVVGDDLTDLAKSMDTQLVLWIRRHSLNSAINQTFAKTAEDLSTYLKVESDANYKPAMHKTLRVRGMLENGTSKVVLIHGLSGMGKSCLARHIAANPPKRFLHGAVDVVFGQRCSNSATGNYRDEYQKRLASKFIHILRALGRRKCELDGISLDGACFLLQESLRGRSILVLLDDVWEPDIITRFTRLYDNNCKYIATTRIRSVYETAEAEKVELTKEDVQDLSMTILMHHSQLTYDELPREAAERLVERCGHHPLTLAVIGKALRGETRSEQWEIAMDELETYASQAPVPNHYMNEKEMETAATVFSSFDYSLNAMVPHAKDLFTSFAALCWDSLIPEACLEALWMALQQQTTFRIVVNRLLEGSLMRRQDNFYRVHDMVALYMQGKVGEGVAMLLKHSKLEAKAGVVPWLSHFGNPVAQRVAGGVFSEIFWSNSEELPATVLWNMVEVLCASNTITDLEVASVKFSRLIGPEVARLFLLDSHDLTAAITRCVASCFTAQDYEQHTFSMIQAGAPQRLGELLKSYNDPLVQRDAAMVLAKLAEYRQDMTEQMLRELPLKELVNLLDPHLEETHEPVLSSVTSLAKATGEEGHTIRYLFRAGLDKKLEAMLLQTGSESTQQRAMVMLKSFNELGGGDVVQNFLKNSGMMPRLPWQMRLNLERLIATDTSITTRDTRTQKGPLKKGWLVMQVAILKNSLITEDERLAALKEVAHLVEKLNDEQVLELVLSADLIGALDRLLADKSVTSTVRLEACLSLSTFASGGPRCIKAILKSKVLENLVHLASNTPLPPSSASSSAQPYQRAQRGHQQQQQQRKETEEDAYWMKETAYETLRNVLFAGGRPVSEHLVRASLVERLISMLDIHETRALGLQAVQDLVEVGGRECIERLFSLRVVDRLAVLEGDAVIDFVKVVRKCSGLSQQEHRLLNQQVQRQARNALSRNSIVSQQLARLEEMWRRGEGSGSGSGSRRRRSNSSSSSNSNSNFRAS